jgi:predicted dehydrogenase
MDIELDQQTVPVLYPVTLDSHNTYGEASAFVDAIETDSKILTDGTEGMRTVEVCLSVIESSRTGLPVKLKYQ